MANKVLFVLVADDGKIFHGSGAGDAFGPRCFKGDIMGCGIMFPRDYFLDGKGKDLSSQELLSFWDHQPGAPQFLLSSSCLLHPQVSRMAGIGVKAA